MDVLDETIFDNKDTFAQLIQSVENDLYNIAKNRVTNPNDIDDILQETIIQIYKNFDKLKNKEYFKTWAIKILINECNKVYHLNNKEHRLFNKLMEKNDFNDEDLSILNLENDLCFQTILSTLPPIIQNIFILYYKCNFSTKKIAEILKMNPNTVKTKLKRSKEIIKTIYQKKGGII